MFTNTTRYDRKGNEEFSNSLQLFDMFFSSLSFISSFTCSFCLSRLLLRSLVLPLTKEESVGTFLLHLFEDNVVTVS